DAAGAVSHGRDADVGAFNNVHPDYRCMDAASDGAVWESCDVRFAAAVAGGGSVFGASYRADGGRDGRGGGAAGSECGVVRSGRVADRSRRGAGGDRGASGALCGAGVGESARADGGGAGAAAVREGAGVQGAADRAVAVEPAAE